MPENGTTYYARGDYNAMCDGCGRKFKASALRQDWRNLQKCGQCWEPRHPQDFARARAGAEPAPVPFTRPALPPSYVTFCTPNGTSSYSDAAVPDCWVVEFRHPMYDPSIF